MSEHSQHVTVEEAVAETFIAFVKVLEEKVRASDYRFGRDILLYRGTRFASWKLLPSLAWRFARRRDREKTLAELEREIFDDFQKRSLQYLDNTPISNLDWLTLAQHHEVPTRLLDWSGNAFAALWFAVNQKGPAAAAVDANEFGAVWMFRTAPDDWVTFEKEHVLDVFRPARLYVHMPRTVTNRITAQHGFFTLHPDDDGKFKPLEQHADYARRLTKILIPHRSFWHFRESLDRMGINRFSIFPGLDGLAHHVRWYHFREDDEPDT